MARSLLLAGQVEGARAAAEHSIDICDQERWNAFVPWPQALRAHCLATAGRYNEARDDAESAFALACQLGDPCWEGMAGRALALLALHAGDPAAAGKWITDARHRCDRLPDRYVWVSGFVALGHLEIAANQQHELVMPLARRLYQDGLRDDLPEFIAWALIYQAEAGDLTNLSLARTLAAGIVNPALQARVAALEDSRPRRSSSVSSWPASRCGPSAPIHRTPHHMRWMVHSESIFPNGPRCLPAASTPITRRGAGAGDVAVTVAVTRRRRASDVA